MPEISVIVPVYNVENKISRCIDSILAQSFTDYELILIDDGSCDRSGKICDAYADQHSRIKVVHQKNSGVSAARNMGIKCADGLYLSFIDSDDYVENDYLLALYAGIKKCQLSICGVFYCNEECTKKTKQRVYPDNCYSLDLNNSNLFADFLRNRRFNYVYSKLFLKDIIDRNNIFFDENVNLGEDTIFVIDYLKRINSISIIGEAYYNYIKYTDNTLTTTFCGTRFAQFTYVNNYIEKGLFEKGLLDSTILNVIDERRFESAVWAINTIMLNSSLAKCEKIQYIKLICYDTSLLSAIARCNEITKRNRLFYALQTQSAKKVYHYYESEKNKKTIMRNFKSFVVKVFPHSVIEKVKKCFQIAQ